MQPVSDSALLGGLKRDFIPSPAYYLQATPESGQVLLKYTTPLAGRYDGVPKLSNDPALIVNRLGKGEVVYFSGDIGNTVKTFHTPELMQLVGNAARHMSKPPVTLENAPGSVEMVVRSQNDDRRTLVHLVNFTGEMTRPIRHIVPSICPALARPVGQCTGGDSPAR
jgi:type 1 glutamine amidotransferase